MNVFENVAFGLEVRKIKKNKINERVKKALELVNLSGFEKRSIDKLSGGQQQRVALARAIVIEPDILLLDEPLSNLDAKLRDITRTELKKLQKKLGITTIFVTHDQEEALCLSDRIAVIEAGICHQVGTPSQIYNYPSNSFVADFIGSSNLISGKIIEIETNYIIFETDCNNTLKIARIAEHMKVDFIKGKRCHLMIRPESIVIEPKSITRLNEIKAKVDIMEFKGNTVNYQVLCENRDIDIVQLNKETQKLFKQGDEVFIYFPEDRILIVD